MFWYRQYLEIAIDLKTFENREDQRNVCFTSLNSMLYFYNSFFFYVFPNLLTVHYSNNLEKLLYFPNTFVFILKIVVIQS